MSDVKRIVLDVLKPHKPSLVDMSLRLAGLKGVDGVSCTLDEVDQETESVKVTIEGTSINYPSVEDALRELGATHARDHQDEWRSRQQQHCCRPHGGNRHRHRQCVAAASQLAAG
ncbi:MAG: DUF211 domain-containing protein, partial [Thermoplasmata archaeon]|nr:DUF211 domain-containing protein [Thermoplasmata archaeon]